MLYKSDARKDTSYTYMVLAYSSSVIFIELNDTVGTTPNSMYKVSGNPDS